jgi:hypothetical protein
MIIILNGDRFTFKKHIRKTSICLILWSIYKISFVLALFRKLTLNTIKISCFSGFSSKQFSSFFYFARNLHGHIWKFPLKKMLNSQFIQHLITWFDSNMVIYGFEGFVFEFKHACWLFLQIFVRNRKMITKFNKGRIEK